MKSRQNIAISIVGIFLLFFITTTHAIPMLPTVIQGQVTINDKPAPENTLITAEIDEKIIKQVNTTNGQYIIPIKGNETTTGKEITFYVDGIKTNTTTTWSSGKVETIDLAVIKKNNNYLYAIIAAITTFIVFITLKPKKKPKK